MSKPIKYILRWQPWLYGLISAGVGGGATAIGAVVLDPEKFNFAEGLTNIAKLFVLSGVVSAALYLMKSPVPKLEEEEE
jgi:hypothetical protein